jgi:hypothetical protein
MPTIRESAPVVVRVASALSNRAAKASGSEPGRRMSLTPAEKVIRSGRAAASPAAVAVPSASESVAILMGALLYRRLVSAEQLSDGFLDGVLDSYLAAAGTDRPPDR